MSVTKINNNLPRQTQINSLSDMVLEVNGKTEVGQFDINELLQIITDLSLDRKYVRNGSLGHTTTNYIDWSHLRAETGYDIWKLSPTSYVYNSVNQLFFDDKLLEARGEAGSESSTAFDSVFTHNLDSGAGFTDNTTEAGTEGGTKFEVMDSTNDYLYIGDDATFSGASFEWQTRGSNYTLVVEYYNGAWITLTANTNTLSDNTSSFESDGRITWTTPSDWSTTTINSTSRYWVRISTSTSPVTTAEAYSIVPYNSVPALLALSNDEILDEDWAWCSYGTTIYVTIRNTSATSTEGNYFINSSSSATNLQNFFVHNHEYTGDYEDSTYVAGTYSIDGQNIPFSQSGFSATNLNDAVEELLTQENLWDRAGTTLTQHYLNDTLDLGSGTITTTGTVNIGDLTCTSLGTQSENLDMGGYNVNDINVINTKAIVHPGHNNTGSTLTAGTAVYVTSIVGGVIGVAVCDSTDKDKMPCIGIVSVNIADGATGNIVYRGIKSMNTSGFTGAVGDRIYVQSDGTLDTVEPTSGSVQRIGTLVTKDASGTIYIYIRGRKSVYASADEHPILRMGSDAGHQKVEFRNYANVEKASIDDDGNFNIAGKISGATYGSDGTVTDAELLYINTLSSNAQTQINAKAPTATPTFTGQATIPTIDLTGGQIAFPATAVPSADPNTIDDYEEGTWTADLNGDETWTTGPVGTYTKIARLVFIEGSFTINVIGTGASDVIYGLPFNSGGSAAQQTFIGFSKIVSAANNFISVNGAARNGFNYFYIRGMAAAGTSDGLISLLGNGTAVMFAGCYSI